MNPRPELAKNQPFYGLEFDGRSFDCGSKAGFLAANVANALERNDVAAGDADGNAWSGKLVTDPASGAKISSKGTLPQILTNNKASSAARSRCSSCEIRYLRPQNPDDLSKHE